MDRAADPQAGPHAPGRIWSGAPLDLSDAPAGLFAALVEARKRYGRAAPIVQDDAGDPLSYEDLIHAAWALGGRIARFSERRDRVGVLAPTCVPAVATFFGLQAIGRVAALLNFSAGAAKILAACRLAGVSHVITSRRFIRTAGLGRLAERLDAHVRLVFLEDLRDALSAMDKLTAAVRSSLPPAAPPWGRRAAQPDDLAVILFTSGTTGAPKGVALSHANLIANIAQCRAHIPFDPDFVFFNALPLFHAFGLTGGTLLPILSGLRTVLHPTPLDHERIPKLISKTGASVLVSTDTFAHMYARAAGPDALSGLRFAVLGGEKVRTSTLDLFKQRSSAKVLQGYGATECGPVISVNQPDADRPDTVGRLLPGMQARLEPLPGVTAGDALLVRGPNVMRGYLDPERVGAVAEPGDAWFETGDLARIDEDGFITVTGRTKRFAKIGAEMVSLTAVEEHASACWPEARHAAIAVREAEAGEIITLVTEQKGADRAQLLTWGRAHGASALEAPRRVFTVRRLPLLPTGKPDLGRIREMVERRMKRARRRRAYAKRASGSRGKSCST
jgi:acyl-[acyl-carrier-protein]-phospholipid O-acyltransferase/long-chain-fatty-acid--[acyl-carrier-protein] ligase